MRKMPLARERRIRLRRAARKRLIAASKWNHKSKQYKKNRKQKPNQKPVVEYKMNAAGATLKVDRVSEEVWRNGSGGGSGGGAAAAAASTCYCVEAPKHQEQQAQEYTANET
jgi:hypothetical protein